MIDTKVVAACVAARRYAQLIYYHDNNRTMQYGHRPSVAWQEFSGQFRSNGMAAYTLVCFAHAREIQRLVDEARIRRTGGPFPPVSNRTAIQYGTSGVHEGGGEEGNFTLGSAPPIHVID